MKDDSVLNNEASTVNNNGEVQPNDDDKKEGGDSRTDNDGDTRMDNVTSQSSIVPTQSQADVVKSSHKITKLETAVHEQKTTGNNKKKRKHSGRVEKRQPRHKKPVNRNTSRMKIDKKKHKDSTSTVASAGSSWISTERRPTCRYCGHRCCRKRYEDVRRKESKKPRDNRIVKTNLLIREKRDVSKKAEQNIVRAECIQVGSTSLMLSPLCENTNVSATQESTDLAEYSDVTPEMIYDTVRRLNMWEHTVATLTVLQYVKRNYPVCQNIPTLYEELLVKLQVAAIVGFITQCAEGRWRLACALEKCQLTPNHVTLFWITYGDTMKPATKNSVSVPVPKTEDQQTTTHDYDVL